MHETPGSEGALDGSLGVFGDGALSPELDATLRAALEHDAASKSANTRRAYAADWSDVLDYCARHGFTALPMPVPIARLYFSWLANVRHTEAHNLSEFPIKETGEPDLPRGMRVHDDGKAYWDPLKLSTIDRRRAAIAFEHERAGYVPPTASPAFKNHFKGIENSLRHRRPTPKRAIQDDDLRELVAAIPMDGTLKETRDRALLLLIFLGGFRRSEVAAFDTSDLQFDPTLGVVCTIQFSKTNKKGDPERVAIMRNADPAICAVRWTEKWLRQAGIRSGKAFRHVLTGNRIGDALSGDGIYDAVRGRVLHALCLWLERHANEDSDLQAVRTKTGRWVASRFTDAVLDKLLKKYELPAFFDPRLVGAHSLRSGLVTTARRKRRPDYAIKRQTRHKNDTMLDRYTHSMTIWDDNVSRDLL